MDRSSDEIEDAVEKLAEFGETVRTRVVYIRSRRDKNGNCSTVVKAYAVTMDRDITDITDELACVLKLRETAEGMIVPCSVMDHPDRWINNNSENIYAYDSL